MCCSYCMMGTCGNVQGLMTRVYVVNGVEIFVSSAFLLLFPFHFCLPFLLSLSLSPFPSLSPSLLIFSLFLPLPLSPSPSFSLSPLSLSLQLLCVLLLLNLVQTLRFVHSLILGGLLIILMMALVTGH